MSDPLDDLAELWRWSAAGTMGDDCPVYGEIARAVAEDRELLALQQSARPHAHLPLMLLGVVHYLVLAGLDHPLADVYAGRSQEPAAPLFRELCLEHAEPVLALLNTRTVQTNEVGRSALVGPALTWASGGEPMQLVDVGCSAGLNMLCDRYRLDYGAHGATGPAASPVVIECDVVGGAPPIAARLPELAGRIGVDLDPPDLGDPADCRWLLACVWPGTYRFGRAAQAIEMGRADPPPVVRGDALESLPGVLGSVGPGREVVLNTWSFSYFSLVQRTAYLGLLARASEDRPVAWVAMDAAGVVDLPFENGAAPAVSAGGSGTDVLSVVQFERGALQRAEVLAYVHSHGRSMQWVGGDPLP